MNNKLEKEKEKKKEASVRLGPKTLRTLDEEVKSLVSAWRSSLYLSWNSISWNVSTGGPRSCSSRREDDRDVLRVEHRRPEILQ